MRTCLQSRLITVMSLFLPIVLGTGCLENSPVDPGRGNEPGSAASPEAVSENEATEAAAADISAESAAANSTTEAAAQAAPLASAGTAPACIHRELAPLVPAGWTVLVTNHCGKTMQVKVVVDLGPDSSCYRMGKGGWFLYWIKLGHYGKTVVCG